MVTATDGLVPDKALGAWLGDRLPGTGAPGIDRITSGHSNELFAVTRGGETVLLRRPPLTANAPGAHDMAREHRILTALDGTGVPHATPRALCTDTAVIGAPFLLMDRVPGQAVYDELPAGLRGQETEIAFALVDALVALHRVDWRAVGLGDLGRPEGYTERQAVRWGKQLRSYAFRDIPELDEVATWLADTCPGTSAAALIHGDYGLHNVLFAPDRPVRLLAIVDWETSTIGDPLADLGYLLASWLAPDETEWAGLTRPQGLAGFPDRAALAARYAAGTGTEVEPELLRWYRALGQFKVAVMLEGSYGRYVRGESADPFFATLEERVPLLARHALAIADDRA